MKEDIKSKFMEYVQINSESGKEKDFSEILVKELKDLGFKIKRDALKKAHESNTSNIIAYLPGKNSNDLVMLCAHMDTVKPGIDIEPIEVDGKIVSKGDTVLGADDKAGIAIIMSAIEEIISSDVNHKGIEVVFTVHEEAGLYGSRALDYSMIQSKKAIVLDSSGEVGGIVIKAPSKEKITAEVIGKSAHAGINPEKGINAIEVASEAIYKMKLSQVDGDTTANIGTVSGGDATNVVPDNVNVTGEVRSFKDDKRSKQIDHMKACIDDSIKKHKAQGVVETELLYEGYDIPVDDVFVKEIMKAGEQAGVKMFTRESQGGSDANVFNAKAIKTVNLVIGTQKAHTTEEYIEVMSLINCQKIIVEYLKEI